MSIQPTFVNTHNYVFKGLSCFLIVSLLQSKTIFLRKVQQLSYAIFVWEFYKDFVILYYWTVLFF